MQTKCRKITAIVLLIAVFFSLIPAANATEVQTESTYNAELEETGNAINDEMISTAETQQLEEEVPTTELQSLEEEVPTTETQPPEEELLAEELETNGETDTPEDKAAEELPMILFAAAPQATKSITVAEKHSFYIGRVTFCYYQNVDGDYYPTSSTWTESCCYFTLSNGAIAYCVEPSKYAVTGEFNESEWSFLVDTEAQIGVARAMAYGAPNNGDTSEDAIVVTVRTPSR